MRLLRRSVVPLFVLLLSAACGSGSSSIAAPASLSGTAMGTGYHLTWKDNSEDEEEFVIERKLDSAAFAEFARVPFNTTQYMVESGDSGKMYTFRVVAVMPGMKSAASNEVMWMP